MTRPKELLSLFQWLLKIQTGSLNSDSKFKGDLRIRYEILIKITIKKSINKKKKRVSPKKAESEIRSSVDSWSNNVGSPPPLRHSSPISTFFASHCSPAQQLAWE